MEYNRDPYWKKVQKFLPVENRLSSRTVPREYFIKIAGMKIHIDHYETEKPKARVILFHGVGGNGRLLSFIALPLMRNGFEVICPDLPLYGYTKYKGTITYDTWVSCGSDILKHYQKDGLGVFLFGLSAGGMLAYQVAARNRGIKGVMATCILDQRNRMITRQTAVNPHMAVLGNAFIRATHRWTGAVKIPMKMVANMKAIANNRRLAGLLMNDRRSSGAWISLEFVHTMLNPVLAVEPEEFTQCPFLLVHPQEDQWTGVELSRLFYDRLACRKEFYLLEGAGHFPVEKRGLKQLETYCITFMEQCLREKDSWWKITKRDDVRV